MDGIGSQHTNAREFSDAYFKRGCLLNAAGFEGVFTPSSAINQHAIYDAARRWSQCVRMIPRTQLVGYAVEDGKSILWFRRDAAAAAGGTPSRVEVTNGQIQAGQTYEVEGGSDPLYDYLEYPIGSGEYYWPGERFTGASGYTSWDSGGVVQVYLVLPGQMYTPAGQDYWHGIADSIAHEAPPGGFTNEWLIDFQFHAYHPSESSLWKPAAYSDYFPFVNRCHFFSTDLGGNTAYKWHTSYGQAANGAVLSPEVPNGWPYARLTESTWANQITVPSALYPSAAHKRRFYKSCRLYEPPAEIDSVETVQEGSDTLVKVTLTSRLHNTSNDPGGAPDSIDRDLDTWVASDVATEPYRTSENAIRLYLLHAYTGQNSSPTYGDDAAAGAARLLADNPYASIYPLTYLVRLVPEPYADENDRKDLHDTPLWSDTFGLMETYLRAMCEGFVDPVETFQRNECQADALLYDCTLNNSGLFDFTFPALCNSAFAGQWIGLMPSEATQRTSEDDTRPDKPRGHGPMPNTRFSSELYNQLASGIDLLTHVRIMIQWSMTETHDLYTGESLGVEGSLPLECADTSCVSANGRVAYCGTARPADILLSTGNSDGFLWAVTSSAVGPGCYAGDLWNFAPSRRVQHYELNPVDPDIVDAFHPSWRAMIETDKGAATLCCYTTGREWFVQGDVATCGSALGSCKFELQYDYTTTCVWAGTGTLDMGEYPGGGWHFLDKATGCVGNPAAHAWLTPLSTIDSVLIIPLADTEAET